MAHNSRQIDFGGDLNNDRVLYTGNNTIPTTAPPKGVDTLVLSDGNRYDWNGTAWILIPTNTCPTPMTRNELIALRNANGLSKDCDYVITDHVQGRLVAGTQIHLQAVSVNELSENVQVNTTYDNEAWQGIYDIDRALVLELQDNRNNIARGINGTEVANFDWGNIAYTNVTVDNAILTVTYGNTAVITNVTIDKSSTVILTGFTGTLNNINISIVSTVNLTNANGSWRFGSIIEASQLTASGYIGGGDSYYFELSDATNFNISNSVGQVNVRTSDMHAMTINAFNLAAGTGALTFLGCDMWQSTFTKGTGSGVTTVNRLMMRDLSIVNHLTGVMTLNNVQCHTGNINQNTNSGATMNLIAVYVKQGANISNSATGALNMSQSSVEIFSLVRRLAGATGILTVNSSTIKSNSIVGQEATNTANTTISASEIIQSSNVLNRSAVVIDLARVILDTSSTVETIATSAGAITISDSVVRGSSVIRKNAISTAGTLLVNSGTILESQSFIFMSGTGNLTATGCSMNGSSGLNVTGGNRSYNFTRLTQTGVSRANLSGNGAVTDIHNELEMHYRAVYNNSSNGAFHTVNYVNIEGVSSILNILGVASSASINRVRILDSIVTINKNNLSNYLLWTIADNSSVTITNANTGDNFQNFDIRNGSTVLINRTGAGSINNLTVSENGTYNSIGVGGAAIRVSVEQGVVTHTGGVLNGLSKKMAGTLTVTGGTQTNISHWTTTNKTTNVNNTSRVDYLGLNSTLPIL